jgi:hypothetical protein
MAHVIIATPGKVQDVVRVRLLDLTKVKVRAAARITSCRSGVQPRDRFTRRQPHPIAAIEALAHALIPFPLGAPRRCRCLCWTRRTT